MAVRIAQQRIAGQHDERQVRKRDVEETQQVLGLGRPLQLQPSKGNAVPGEHLEQAPGVAIEPGADQGESRAAFGQSGVANEHGAQDVLAEVGLLGHDDPHLLNRHAQHTASGPHHGRQVHPLTRQQALFPEELPLAVGDDHFLGRLAEVLDNLDGALEDDDEVIARIAIGEEHVTSADLHLGAVETEGGQL